MSLPIESLHMPGPDKQLPKPGAPEDGPSPIVDDKSPQTSTDKVKPITPQEDDKQDHLKDNSDTSMGQALARLMQCLIEEWQVIEEDPVQTKGNQGMKRVFALMRQKTSKQRAQSAAKFTAPAPPNSDRYDYQQKYAEDAHNEGMSPNARVWRVFLDEAGPFDIDMVDNIRDTVDVILVFAGLFSAIVSTLVSQASTALQPDYGHITSALLTELIEVQRAIASGANPIDVARSTLTLASPSTSTSPDRWVNAMWFISLAFSLSTALLAVLIKQWIQAFVSPISGTPQHQGRVRHFRYMGIEKWQVPLIVGILPTLLHLSLFLFFIGLVVLLSTLDTAIAAVVGCIALLAYAAYTVSNVLPVWYPECPYKTPISSYTFIIVRIFSPRLQNFYEELQGPFAPIIHYAALLLQKSRSALQPLAGALSLRALLVRDLCARALQRSRNILLYLFSLVRGLLSKGTAVDVEEGAASDHLASVDTQSETGVEQTDTIVTRTLKQSEAAAVLRVGDQLDSRMLSWLCNTTTNPSVRIIVSSAVVDLRLEFPDEAMDVLHVGVLKHLCNGLKDCTLPVPGSFRERESRRGMLKEVSWFLGAHIRVLKDHKVGPRAHCRCDWSFGFLPFEPHYSALKFIRCPPVTSYWTQPDIQMLEELQPPTTPRYLWISMLKQGIYNHLSHSNNPGDPALHLSDDNWDAFASLWTLNYRDMVRDRRWVGTHGPYEPFLLLQGILLSVFLCQWSADLVGCKVSHHALISPHMVSSHTPAEALLCKREELAKEHQHLRLHYDLQTTFNVLLGLIATCPPGVDPFIRTMEKLLPLRDYIFPTSYDLSLLSNISQEHSNGGHLAFFAQEQMRHLIPTPDSIIDFLSPTSSPDTKHPAPWERLDMVLRMCKFLMQVNKDQVFPVCIRNNLLEALNVARQDLLRIDRLRLPWEGREGIVPELAPDIVIAYLDWASSQADRADHLDYIFQHVTLLCACSVVSYARGVGDLLPECLRKLMVQRPIDPAWDRVIADLPEMQELDQWKEHYRRPWYADSDQDLIADFINNLTSELDKVRKGDHLEV